MSRRGKNIIDYFPHYCTPGKTLFILENQYGLKGYAIWFKTLELLGSSEFHYIDLRNESNLLFIVSKLKTTEKEMNDIYNLLSKLNAIDKFLWDKKIIFSSNFIQNIEDAYKRRNNKCMQYNELCKHLKLKCKHNKGDGEINVDKSTQSKVEYSKVKKSKRDYIKEEYLPIFERWLNYKKDKNQTYKNEDSIKMAYNKLYKLSDGDPKNAIKIIEQSLANNWAGLFKIKENKETGHQWA